MLPHNAVYIKKTFNISGKAVTLYPTSEYDRPLVVFHTPMEDGEQIMHALNQLGGIDINLLVIGNLNWNHDMTPWNCPPLSKQDTGAAGGADDYLKVLLSEILPKAKNNIKGTPSKTCITGYSLSGLFALYALYQCDVFDCAASMSGSLWFPDFLEFVKSHDMMRKPDKLYLSLGDKEAKTRHPLMKNIHSNTQAIAEHYEKLGISVVFEMNPGNHFKDVEKRCAKGIFSIVQSVT